MNTKIIPKIGLLFSVIFLASACDDAVYREYMANKPIYLSYTELRSGVKNMSPEPLEYPGKIYFKDNYIFIVEELKGVHLFDNSNPAAPVKKGFLKLPGVMDITITDSYLYADSFVDLVIVDLSDLENMKEVGRVKDVFPYAIPQVDNEYPVSRIDEKKGVVIGYEVTRVKEKYVQYDYPIIWFGAKFTDMINSTGASSGINGSGVGIAGSMARFGIKGNTLYLVNSNSLDLYNITKRDTPAKLKTEYAGWGIETMFLTDSYMFLGTQTGMIIYDLTVPESPLRRTFFNHARSCDPVIVDGNLAYVTLRSGNNCGGTVNVLDIVDISNIDSPSLLKTYPMFNPHGLGKSGDLLFICDGAQGLKIYDAADPLTVTSHLLYHYPAVHAWDVIPLGNVLVMIGEDGLFQYDYSDPSNIFLISTIAPDSK